MYTDIVVIAGGVDISKRISAKVGGVEVEPIEILHQRMYGVPYGAEVTINNNSQSYNFDLYFYMSQFTVKQIPAGTSDKFIAVRDLMIKDVAVSATSETSE